MPGTIGNVDAARAHPVEIAQIEVVVEEELGDGARRAGVDLAPSARRYRPRRRRFPDASRDRPRPRPRNRRARGCRRRVGGRLVALGMRHDRPCRARRRIAAQRHDVAHAGVAIGATTSSTSSRVAATQVRCAAGFSVGFLDDARDGGVGALARRAAGAVGHGHEARPSGARRSIELPQGLLHLVGLRREEFEGDADAARPARLARRDEFVGHQATSSFEAEAERVGDHARVAGEPERDGELVGIVALAARRSRCRRDRARRRASQSPISSCGEAEAAMGMRLAQELELMRREIDDEQPAAGRAARAPPRAGRARRIVEEVQHLMR